MQIEERAMEVAADNHFTAGKDSIHDLATNLGGKIEYLTADDMDYLESGSLEVRGPNDFIIRLSPITSLLRDNFTIAHELGHYFLHSGEKPGYGTNPIKIGRYGTGTVEQQANRFAAALLMPRQEFSEAFARVGNHPSTLAGLFLVSRPAVEARINSLRLA
ncbi:MAG TPA: ImmA/IrrE family metallo-endopeptidase [Candidatus Methylacidiphilales bacterium]|nr:ImmA/IrrE family metallo-endopeptidase [Candidatus Methylacidiphilales bacterium]